MCVKYMHILYIYNLYIYIYCIYYNIYYFIYFIFLLIYIIIYIIHTHTHIYIYYIHILFQDSNDSKAKVVKLQDSSSYGDTNCQIRKSVLQ